MDRREFLKDVLIGAGLLALPIIPKLSKKFEIREYGNFCRVQNKFDKNAKEVLMLHANETFEYLKTKKAIEIVKFEIKYRKAPEGLPYKWNVMWYAVVKEFV